MLIESVENMSVKAEAGSEFTFKENVKESQDQHKDRFFTLSYQFVHESG